MIRQTGAMRQWSRTGCLPCGNLRATPGLWLQPRMQLQHSIRKYCPILVHRGRMADAIQPKAYDGLLLSLSGSIARER